MYKKSVVANIIYTFILIGIAVGIGLFLQTIFEKNKELILKNNYPIAFDLKIYLKDYVQDPEYVYFYIGSLYPIKTTITYKIPELGLTYQEEKIINGLTKIEKNISDLFGVSSSSLNGKILNIYVMTNKGTQDMKTISLSTSTKILKIKTNVPSYLQTNLLYNLYPGENVIYLEINPSSVVFYDLYKIETINLDTTKKVEVLNLNENFNLDDYSLTFLDINTSNPIVGAKVYINNFFVGYTDGEGKFYFKYHNGKEILVELESQCYKTTVSFNVNSNETIQVKNTC